MSAAEKRAGAFCKCEHNYHQHRPTLQHPQRTKCRACGCSSWRPVGGPLPQPSPPTTEQGLISLNAAQEAWIRDWATKPIERWHNSEVRFINLSRFAQCILQEQSNPESSPPSAAPWIDEAAEEITRRSYEAARGTVCILSAKQVAAIIRQFMPLDAERVAPQPAPTAPLLNHAELCRLSRIFNNAADLQLAADVRINEWLKRQIEHAAAPNPDERSQVVERAETALSKYSVAWPKSKRVIAEFAADFHLSEQDRKA